MEFVGHIEVDFSSTSPTQATILCTRKQTSRWWCGIRPCTVSRTGPCMFTLIWLWCPFMRALSDVGTRCRGGDFVRSMGNRPSGADDPCQSVFSLESWMIRSSRIQRASHPRTNQRGTAGVRRSTPMPLLPQRIGPSFPSKSIVALGFADPRPRRSTACFHPMVEGQ